MVSGFFGVPGSSTLISSALRYGLATSEKIIGASPNSKVNNSCPNDESFVGGQSPSRNNMAARNRPRGAFAKDDLTDAHEERNMWSQIVTDIKRLRTTHARAAEVAKLLIEMEAKMGNCKFPL